MASDATTLSTSNDANYADDATNASVKQHQRDHDTIAAFTNTHPTDPDPHGDRAYTDTAIANASLSGLTTAQVNALIATESTHTVTANYTLALADAGKEVAVNASTATTVTIPTVASVAFPAGTVIAVKWQGAGSVSITAASGVTLNGLAALASSHLLAGQFARVFLKSYGGDVWHATGEFALSASAIMPVPTGTPVVGQVPVVTTASPLALAWGNAATGGGGSLYVGQMRGLTSGSASQSTAISPGGTVIPLGLAGRVVGLDTTTHANAITVPTGLNGDYLVVAKAKVSTSSGTVSLANLTNGDTPTGGSVTATGGRVRFSVGSAGGYSSADTVSRTFGSSPISAADVDVTLDLYLSGESYPTIMARANNLSLKSSTAVYMCQINNSGTQLAVSKYIGGTGTTLGTYTFQIPVGTLGRVRFSVVGTALKAWIETGTAAFGGAPNISVTDSAITAAGYVGLSVQGGSAASSGAFAEIDNLLVTNGAGSPTTLVSDGFDGSAPTVDQKSLSITVNGSVVETVTENASAPRLGNTSYLTLNAGDYVGLKADGPTAYTVEALVANDVSLTLVKQ